MLKKAVEVFSIDSHRCVVLADLRERTGHWALEVIEVPAEAGLEENEELD